MKVLGLYPITLALVAFAFVSAAGETRKSTPSVVESHIASARAEWVPTIPQVALASSYDAVDPLAIRTASGQLLVVAESCQQRGLWLSRSEDGGVSWQAQQQIAEAPEGFRITAGAAGTLPSGRLVLAWHQWQEVPGKIDWTSEEPRGVHHYSWTGVRRSSVLKVVLSDDEGRTWLPAACDTAQGPVAPAAMGRVISAAGALWFALYGPADAKEMGAALSSVGLMRSDDAGKSWRFSHWVVRASVKHAIGYGPGEIVPMPDGRWLGMLQANYRGLGDYSRPRICRTLSTDGGRRWSEPIATLLGPKPTLIPLDGQRLMVGTRQERGVIYNLMLNAGLDLLYQDHLWECIWYQNGERGGLNLLRLDSNTLLAVYHWQDKAELRRCEIRSQIVRQRTEFGVKLPKASQPANRKSRWTMAEAYQVPDIADAPSGVRIGTLLRLHSGDWICIGYAQTLKGGAHGFSASGLVVLRSPAIEGPWKRIADLPVPEGTVTDTGTGSNIPGVMMQTKTGLLLLPFARGQWNSPTRDVELLFSDDEGRIWDSLGHIGQQLGMSRPFLSGAARIHELEDGRLMWLLHLGREGWNPAKGDLHSIVSANNGATWSQPRLWAKSQEKHYPELPYGRDGWVRAPEGSVVITGGGHWLGIYREERGTLAPEDRNGPTGMPHLMLTRSFDGGRSWTPAFGFLGVEPDMAVLPDGSVLVTYREDCLATAWLSYDEGRTWQMQVDPAEMPWRRGAAEAHTQWPPGGESVIRVLDGNTAVVITDTGLLPSGKPMPAGHVLTKELHGRVQVRFFRRQPAQ